MSLMDRTHDALKMLFGSSVSVVGGAWSWIGNNNQEIGALCAIIGLVYATFYFVHWVRSIRKRR